MNNANNGYIGYSMSNRAQTAYNSGEKPISKWTKTDIISEINSEYPEKAAMLKNVPAKVLKERLLVKSSWHHTSEYFNRTDFYSIDFDLVKKLNLDLINEFNRPVISEEKKDNRFNGCIEYIEWTGTRKHPVCNRKKLDNVLIEERGCFYYVYNENGKEILKKKIDSNGTYVKNYDKENAKLAKMKANSPKEAFDYFMSIKDNCEESFSGHIYASGRKPSRFDYDAGIEKFFKVGENRLFKYPDGSLKLETWNGSEWK